MNTTNKTTMTTTEKWRQTGLLEMLDNEDQCNELASALEAMSHRLLEDVPPYTKESEQFASMASMILPIVRRLYEDIKPLPNIHWIHDDFKQFYNEQKELKEDCKQTAVYKIDEEAMFIALYVDDVVNRLTNP